MNALAIKRLNDDARASLLAHLLALPVADQRLRFGRVLAPAAIASYVDHLDFARDAILGIHDDQNLVVGMAHVAFDTDPAEVALSVVPAWRAKGLGRALFSNAVAEAARRGLARIYMQFLATNTPIVRIARRFGMSIRSRGSDAEAHLDVPTQHRKQMGAVAEIVPMHAVDRIAS